MKRFTLSVSLTLLSAVAFSLAISTFGQPALAQRRQLSTPSQVSDTAGIHDLVQYNRDARNKK